MKLTPMLEQYLRVKSEHPDALLFFRLGDFYELFFEDAERAARLLDLTLTSRSKKDDERIPMCGVPYHSVQPYIAKLLAAGMKVAICDQVEDPTTAKGLVDRAVVRVVTPATVTEEECLDPKTPNFLASVTATGDGFALAAVDLSTGEMRVLAVAEVAGVADELSRLLPRELLMPEGMPQSTLLQAATPQALVSELPSVEFSAAAGSAWFREQNTSAPNDGVCAAVGAVLAYIARTHRASVAHLRAPQPGDGGACLALDEATRRNLELLSTLRGERRGSLLWVLDHTRTPMGGRLLRSWLLAPLTDPAAIGARLDAVEELVEKASWRGELVAALDTIGDLERLGARLAANRVTPRDLLGLAAALATISRLQAALGDARAPRLTSCREALDDLPNVQARIAAAIGDEPPLNPHAGGLIRAGFDPAVDELRELSRSGKAWMARFESAERARTGIQSLKVRYNNVFGYYIEITKPNLHLVPNDYRRKQTVANAERFVTPELETYEAKVLGAEERLRAREFELFSALVSEIGAEQARLGRSATAVALLDVLCALATVAERQRYCRPQLVRESGITIRDGRHPVVELMAERAGFVPNDCRVDPDTQQLLVITGPNMAGKSTYLRQVALIVLMAQIGSFVPASAATIGIVDRLFTRVGASDNLAGGESTFMVEMKETAHILAHLTGRSLVILDEIGRGTSTFDGISIAWAVAEYLHDEAPGRPLVLFATHYHELTDLARTKPRVQNHSVAVREWKGEIVFLRRIVSGPASQSYGIQVAQLAGVPTAVIGRAKEILRNLEQGELTDAGVPRLAQHNGVATDQLPLFGGSPAPRDHLRDELSQIDVDRLTPLDALTRLNDLVRRARDGE
ncbi:MAG TPA: DNA mismatch repair protein MutS [Candidatus Kryptonia bacterium]|nr:DNA mismatch repair protein MutS [Candidatus Kryptonia bacterium]